MGSQRVGHDWETFTFRGRGGEKPSGGRRAAPPSPGRQVPLTEPWLWASPRTHVHLSPRPHPPPPAPPRPPRTSNSTRAHSPRGSPHTDCWSFPPPGDEEERSCRRGRASPLHPAALLRKQPRVKSGLYHTDCWMPSGRPQNVTEDKCVWIKVTSSWVSSAFPKEAQGPWTAGFFLETIKGNWGGKIHTLWRRDLTSQWGGG